MNIHWDHELGELLSRLSTTQEQLLALLTTKHDLLLRRDHEALQRLLPEEEALCAELQSCHEHRQLLLERAHQQGLPSDSIQSLADALPEDHRRTLHDPLAEAHRRSRLLQHQSLTHWVVVQRTLLHLSQMLEVIATGGSNERTYGQEAVSESSGALMDQAV